jgi:hypothetical protein
VETPSATPRDARAHQEKIGFSIPRRRLPLHFEDAKAAPGKGKSSGSKRWGVALDVGNSGSVIERNLEVVKAADWIIDLGLGAVIVAGPPRGRREHQTELLELLSARGHRPSLARGRSAAE